MDFALISMMKDAGHDGNTSSPTFVPHVKTRKQDINLFKSMSNAIKSSMTNVEKDDQKALRSIKRQKLESETYERLTAEYIDIVNLFNKKDKPAFITSLNKNRLQRLEQ